MRRDQILDAASESLALGSVADLDLAEIANKVGLKPTSVRYYFRNREDLAEALYHRRLEELEESLAAAEEQESLSGAVATIFDIELENYAQYLEGKANRRSQLGEVRTLHRSRRSRVGARYREALERTRNLLSERSVPAGQTVPLAAAQLLLENLFWLPAWIDDFRDWEFGYVRDQLTALTCGGILPRTVTPDWKVLDETGAGTGKAIDNAAFLRTATQLICRKGYRGTSIDAIAAELGVTKGSFYHHNRIKESLVEQCFEESYNRMGEFQRKAAEMAGNPVNSIATVLASIIRVQLDQREPLLRASALPGLPRAIRVATIERSKPVTRWYVSELSRAAANGGVNPVDPNIAAQFISIGANATYDLARFHNYNSTRDSIENCLRLILYGVVE